MRAKHTPGPWEIDYDTRPADVCCVHGLPQAGEDGKQTYAYVRGEIGYWAADEAENYANLQLIRSAPDLLAALEAAVDCGMVPVSSCADGGANARSRQVQVADMIRAAIAKALGLA